MIKFLFRIKLYWTLNSGRSLTEGASGYGRNETSPPRVRRQAAQQAISVCASFGVIIQCGRARKVQ